MTKLDDADAERQRLDMLVNELKPLVFRLVFWSSVGGALIGLFVFLLLIGVVATAEGVTS